MILVNFKIYRESWAENGVKLARICRKVEEESGIKIIPVVAAMELHRVKEAVGGEIYLQGGEIWEEGAHSGAISVLQAAENGATGVLLNHSERKLPPGQIRRVVSVAPEGMKTVVCLETMGQMERWGKRIKADWLAWEPKELIGSKEKSVASEKQELIGKMAKVTTTPLLVGAGIHSRMDVEVSLKMGAVGVLVSSDIVLAADPEKELEELAGGFLMRK